MSDVVLVYPDLDEADGTDRMLPLSVLYPATVLTRGGYDVEIIDQRVDRLWPQNLKRLLLRRKVLCVGISSMTGPQIGGGLAASLIVKETSPETPVIWGGVHPSMLPEQTLSHPYVDAVIVGEGEETLLETVERLAGERVLTELPGLCLEVNGNIVSGRPRPHLDLNALPPLAYDLVNVRAYTRAIFEKESADWMAMQTSRGCPYGCTYCYSQSFSMRKWRALSPERTVEEIERVVRDFSIHNIFLFDDNFFVDQRRVHRICELISDRQIPIRVHNANWRVDSILAYEMERICQLKAAGFGKVFVGVESGSDEVLKRIGKGITCAQVLEANDKLKRAGIKPVFAFMVGFPFESRRDVKATLGMMNRLLSDNPDALLPGMSIYSPFPGTALFEECRRAGMKVPDTLAAWCGISYAEVNFKGSDSGMQRLFWKAAVLSYFLDLKNIRGEGRIKNLLKLMVSFFARLRIRIGLYSIVPETMFVSYRVAKRRGRCRRASRQG